MITMPLGGLRVVLLSGTKIAMPRSLRVGPSFHISFRTIDINFSQRHTTQKLQLGIYVQTSHFVTNAPPLFLPVVTD